MDDASQCTWRGGASRMKGEYCDSKLDGGATEQQVQAGPMGNGRYLSQQAAAIQQLCHAPTSHLIRECQAGAGGDGLRVLAGQVDVDDLRWRRGGVGVGWVSGQQRASPCCCCCRCRRHRCRQCCCCCCCCCCSHRRGASRCQRSAPGRRCRRCQRSCACRCTRSCRPWPAALRVKQRGEDTQAQDGVSGGLQLHTHYRHRASSCNGSDGAVIGGRVARGSISGSSGDGDGVS